MKYLRLFLFMILIKGFSSCEGELSEPENSLSVKSAHDVIAAWINTDYNTEMSLANSFTVEEIIVEDVLQSLGGQIFKIISDVPSLNNRTVFIKDQKVTDLSKFVLLGAWAPRNWLLLDLDKDNTLELFYTINHGSGILRTDIFCYLPEPRDTVLMASNGFLMAVDEQIRLRRTNSDSLQIVLKSTTEEIQLGNIFLHNMPEAEYLETILEKNIPVETIDRTTGS